MVSKKASIFATKIVLRDTEAKTVGEAQEDYKKLIEDKPHQFSLHNKVTTREQVSQRANYFSHVDEHYPAGMSTCYTVGLSGDCGFSCPDFQDGICEVGEDMLSDTNCVQDSNDFSEDEIIEFKDLYGMLDD